MPHSASRGPLFRSPRHPYTQMLLSSMLEGKEPMSRLLSATETDRPAGRSTDVPSASGVSR